MKLISLQKNLKASVYAVNHIAQKNVSLPILNNILISAQDGAIKLVSTNLEIGITSLLRGKIEREGAFTVDARVFSEYVNLLENEKVEIELVENELTVVCGTYKTKIKGMTAEEFPFIPTVDRSTPISLPIADFSQAVSQVLFAAAQDENRPELSGVLAVLSGKTLTLAATDSYRLAEKKILVSGDAADRRFIIPVRTLQEVVRIAGSDSGEEESVDEVTLYVSDNQCLFVVGGTEIVSRLIDGQYPEYAPIIPTRHACRAELSRAELSRAVKAAAIFSKNGVNDIILEFSAAKKQVTVSAASGLAGEQAASLSAAVSGTDASITLNYRYVLDVVSVLSGDSIVFEVVDADTPCVVKGSGSEYLYIIMPIRK